MIAEFKTHSGMGSSEGSHTSMAAGSNRNPTMAANNGLRASMASEFKTCPLLSPYQGKASSNSSPTSGLIRSFFFIFVTLSNI